MDDLLVRGVGFDISHIFCDRAGKHSISLGNVGKEFAAGGG